jgi:glycosyltransferase involved in cell wall biosynthesis
MIPITSTRQSGFGEDTREDTKRLISPHLASLARADHDATEGPIVWYYTPMALRTLPDDIEPSLVVFDAMDDLASFRNAPQTLRDQEDAMFRAADLVFAGGPSLYEARRHRHPSVHCFPSGVEVGHFARAAEGLVPPDGLAALPHPVLGFYGVLDERIDFDLIATVADARPYWTVALVGPCAKIEESDLPRRPNIVYFGQQPYTDLPAFLAGFDVALLPFALNEATRSISPTKTLEYLAAQKPVVSTPIADVVSLYGDVVRIAENPVTFVTEVEAALIEPISEQQRRRAAGQAHLLAHDWDAIVDGMATLMVEALTIENPTARSGT